MNTARHVILNLARFLASTIAHTLAAARLHSGKRAVQVYDYADLDIRCWRECSIGDAKVYEAVAIPFSCGKAPSGLAPEVPLPIDPEWKRDYAASIRRLIRDGVDFRWRTSFVHCSRRGESDPPSDQDCASSPRRCTLMGLPEHGAQAKHSSFAGSRPCRKPPAAFA